MWTQECKASIFKTLRILCLGQLVDQSSAQATVLQNFFKQASTTKFTASSRTQILQIKRSRGGDQLNVELRIQRVTIHFSERSTGQPPCSDAGSGTCTAKDINCSSVGFMLQIHTLAVQKCQQQMYAMRWHHVKRPFLVPSLIVYLPWASERCRLRAIPLR